MRAGRGRFWCLRCALLHSSREFRTGGHELQVYRQLVTAQSRYAQGSTTVLD
jgi:hypothetical protein